MRGTRTINTRREGAVSAALHDVVSLEGQGRLLESEDRHRAATEQASEVRGPSEQLQGSPVAWESCPTSGAEATRATSWWKHFRDRFDELLLAE